jgi:hypothetical protein
LELGARVLDFRPSVDLLDLKWKICHSAFVGPELKGLLEQVNDFLSKNKSEFVILMLRNTRLNGKEGKEEELLKMLEDIFGDLIYQREDDINKYTIGELINKNKQILISVNDKNEVFKKSNLIWYNVNSKLMFNTYADQQEFPIMREFNTQMVSYFKTGVKPDVYIPGNGDDKYNTKNLFILSWTQTGSTKTILESIKADSTFSNIYDISKTALNSFGDFYSEMSSKWEYPIMGNLFLMDFLNKTSAENIIRPLITF